MWCWDLRNKTTWILTTFLSSPVGVHNSQVWLYVQTHQETVKSECYLSVDGPAQITLFRYSRKSTPLATKCGLSRRVVFGDRFNYTEMKDFLLGTGGLPWQWSLKIDLTVQVIWRLRRVPRKHSDDNRTAEQCSCLFINCLFHQITDMGVNNLKHVHALSYLPEPWNRMSTWYTYHHITSVQTDLVVTPLYAQTSPSDTTSDIY